jgi:hypothetical protein
MGKMKEVFQLKQEMIERNSFLEDMPDKFFIDIYLYQRDKLNELKKEDEDYELRQRFEDINTALPQDDYNYDPDGEGTIGVN